MRNAIVVSKSKDAWSGISDGIGREFKVEHVPEIAGALNSAQKFPYDFIFIEVALIPDLDPKSGDGDTMLLFRTLFAAANVVVLAPGNGIRRAVKAIKAGACDYISFPVEPMELRHVIKTIDSDNLKEAELESLREGLSKSDSFSTFSTKNPAMEKVFKSIRSVSRTKATVLLIGETGTGKNVLARLIHKNSRRKDNQFITVHCGAIPDSLVESELFGHEKGAFTGAVQQKRGKFEIADGGTIFLDEIGTLTPASQIKLLQVLQGGTFQRVGGEKTIAVDVRIISATNSDLKDMCEQGTFRKDLYYRLNVFPIEIPNLRKRSEDIPYFLDLFLKKMEQEEHKGVTDISPEMVEKLKQYPWPGNVRELENIIERAYITAHSSMLTKNDFPDEIVAPDAEQQPLTADADLSLSDFRGKAVEIAEKAYIRKVLEKNCGKMKSAAKNAGITPRQLHRLMSKYKIQRNEFK